VRLILETNQSGRYYFKLYFRFEDNPELITSKVKPINNESEIFLIQFITEYDKDYQIMMAYICMKIDSHVTKINS
jgi:hypothetical protein